jgi:hypothetical protein
LFRCECPYCCTEHTTGYQRMLLPPEHSFEN